MNSAPVVLLFILCTIFCVSSVYPDEQQYSKQLGIVVHVEKLIASANGGSILVGDREISGYAQPFLAKLGLEGQLVWARSIQLGSNYYGTCLDVVETDEGEIITIGQKTKFDNSDTDPFIIKFDRSGRLLWKKAIIAPETHTFRSLALSSRRVLIVAGEAASFSSGSDAWVVAVSQSGVVEWARVVARPGVDSFYTISNGVGDTFFLAGTAEILGTTQPSKIIAIKLDSTGKVLWKKLLLPSGALSSQSSAAFSSAPSGTGVVLGGYHVSLPSGPLGVNGYTAKLSSQGQILWQRSIGNIGQESIKSIAATENGLVLVGQSSSLGSNQHGFLMKMTDTGNVLIRRKFGSDIGGDLHSVATASGGAILLAGWYSTPLFPNITNFSDAIVRTDSKAILANCSALASTPIPVGPASLRSSAFQAGIQNVLVTLTALPATVLASGLPQRELCP